MVSRIRAVAGSVQGAKARRSHGLARHPVTGQATTTTDGASLSTSAAFESDLSVEGDAAGGESPGTCSGGGRPRREEATIGWFTGHPYAGFSKFRQRPQAMRRLRERPQARRKSLQPQAPLVSSN